MDEYMVALRIIHILAGTFWIGASIVFAFFIEPTAHALGPAAGPFMGHMVEKKKLPIVIAITSVIALLAGILLYWRNSSGFQSDWMSTAAGTAFGLGGGTAILAWVLGFTIIRPGISRMQALTQQVTSGDTSVKPQLDQIAGRLKTVGGINVALLVFTVVAMASARYL